MQDISAENHPYKNTLANIYLEYCVVLLCFQERESEWLCYCSISGEIHQLGGGINKKIFLYTFSIFSTPINSGDSEAGAMAT